MNRRKASGRLWSYSTRPVGVQPSIGSRSLLLDERGGVHLLLFGLMGMMAAALVWALAFNWMLQSHSKNKIKPLLDHATHAASLSIDPLEAAKGRLVWDAPAGTAQFYRNLQLNLKLDNRLNPQPGSPLNGTPIVHTLEFVSRPSYPFVLERSVTVQVGAAGEVKRTVHVTLYGPSVVAVLEIRQPLLATSRSEPIVLSSAASVRFR